MSKLRYLVFACGICLALAVFALGILLVGYQAWDAKHVVTLVVLFVAAVVLGFLAYREAQRRG